MKAATVLVVDDDALMAASLRHLLETNGYFAEVCLSAPEAIARVEAGQITVVITDLRLGNEDGLALLAQIHEFNVDTPVIVLTGHGCTRSAIQALRKGAADYIMKPFNNEYLLHRVKAAAKRAMLTQELRELRKVAKNQDGTTILGTSGSVRRLKTLIRRFAPTNLPILIRGETGTGKELVAREIHRLSERSNAPFVAVNCGAMNAGVLESELFGHVKGAFTGATTKRDGYFHAANRGVLFLDEVGDMPHTVQVSLLRVLQEGEVLRVGASTPDRVDVRVLAASHKVLADEVTRGRFREDLFYRLNVMEIAVPTLRERNEDVALLALHFLDLARKEYNTLATRFSQEALSALVHYSWPGNVRELRNVVTRGAAMSDNETIGIHALPESIRDAKVPTAPALEGEIRTLAQVERAHIESVLKRVKDNKSKAARLLGIDRATLYRKCKAFERSQV